MFMLSYLIKYTTEKCSRSLKDTKIKTVLNLPSQLKLSPLPPGAKKKRKELRWLKNSQFILFFLYDKIKHQITSGQPQGQFFSSSEVLSLDLHCSEQSHMLCSDDDGAFELSKLRCDRGKIIYTQFPRFSTDYKTVQQLFSINDKWK